jgi:hypothetical protein
MHYAGHLLEFWPNPRSNNLRNESCQSIDIESSGRLYNLLVLCSHFSKSNVFLKNGSLNHFHLATKVIDLWVDFVAFLDILDLFGYFALFHSDGSIVRIGNHTVLKTRTRWSYILDFQIVCTPFVFLSMNCPCGRGSNASWGWLSPPSMHKEHICPVFWSEIATKHQSWIAKL